MRKAKSYSALGLLLAGLFAAIVLLWAWQAKANEPDPILQAQEQDQSQTQTQTSSSVSGGGQGGGASNQFTERNTSIGVAMASPIPIAPYECWFPKKGWGRAHRLGFGLWEESAVLERDEQCVDDIRAAREYELAKLEAERQLQMALAARISAEAITNEPPSDSAVCDIAPPLKCPDCAEHATRVLEACAAK